MNFRIIKYDRVDSTNDIAHELARDGAEEGMVIQANYQRAGRGRRGRSWASPSGKNLLFSIVVKPKCRSSEAPHLTYLAVKALRDALEGSVPDHKVLKIKKPNDLLYDGKKLCGILTEAQSSGKQVEYVVIGIGLNVNSKRRALPPEATSLLEITKKEHDLNDLLESLLKTFGSQYKAHFNGKA